MLSRRVGSRACFFRSNQPTSLSIAETDQLEALIAAQNQALAIKKIVLLSLRADLIEARESERNALFFANKTVPSCAEILKKFRELKKEIDKHEQDLTSLEINLKQLKNEAIDELLLEKAENYSLSVQDKLTRIFQI